MSWHGTLRALLSLVLLVLAAALPATPACNHTTTPTPAVTPTRAFIPPYTIHPTDHIFREQQPAPPLQQKQQSQVEPLPAHVTAAPPGHDQDAALARQGYTQTTYYTCRTARDGGAEQCGWHVPLLKVAEGGGASTRGTRGVLVVGVVVGAAVFAMGML